MFLTNFTFASLLLLVTSSRAWDPSKRICPSYTRLCFTSFIWCDREVENNDYDCSWPENAYPVHADDYPGPPAVISRGIDYNLSWTGADPNYPVQLEWQLPCISDGWNCGSDDDRVRWQYNTSVPPPTWLTFPPSIDSFIYNNGTNASVETVLARFALAESMQITVSQPEVPDRNGEPRGNSSHYSYPYYDNSDSFILDSSWALGAIKNGKTRVRRSYNHDIRLGVGIGVGLGVPLVVAISVLSTWAIMRKRSPKQVYEKGTTT